MIKKFIKTITPKQIIDARHLFFAWYGAIKYNHPSKELLVIGITGTSGKSTTVSFLRELLEASGHTVGALSTVDFSIAGTSVLNDKKMTMLGHAKTQKYLRQMVDHGCDIAIIESTSQGSLQYRHRYINFDIFGITNLYHEHIEAHGGFEPYKQAKIEMFRYMASLERKHINNQKIDKIAVVNADMLEHKEFIDFNFDKEVLFGTNIYVDSSKNRELDYKYSEISQTKEGLRFKINNQNIVAPQVNGVHNAGNITCAAALAIAAGDQKETVLKHIKKLTSVAGRLEFIKEHKDQTFDVVVDYAFEPVAMEALYSTILPLHYKKIIHVLGATGGGRDKSRRAPLGRLAGTHAAYVVITNEDPYDEDPRKIMNDVEVGVKDVGMKLSDEYCLILDRREAIKQAISQAKPGDIVLITGKGSEQGMCLANEQIVTWDDRQVARDAIKELYESSKA